MIGRPLALVLAVAIAPLQCGHAYDPALSKDETPGYALWQLAKRFHDQHDDTAARHTLEYLVEQYPASRWAAAAQEELGQGRDGGGDGGAG
ncbi:MAG: tetratricopeptide repeat protein [Polyangiaceae bacterium]|jgi:outer membrane protein assembly factor BamD (BamD/ComL family)